MVASDLLRGVERAVGDSSRLLVLAVQLLVEKELLDASEQSFLVQRLCVVLLREQFGDDLISDILISRFLVAVNTAINSSSEAQLLFSYFCFQFLVPYLNWHGAADHICELVLW